MEREELFKACLQHFGKDAQIFMALEEMGELIQAISREMNFRPNNVVEELADALLMLEQLKYMIGEDKVNRQIKIKEERIWERIKREGA